MSALPAIADRPRVLFVDDEPRVLNSMRIMFRREYDTYFADSGRAALEILGAHDIDVVVCDHRMPEMTGVEVLARAKALSPRSVRILLTGYADLNAVEGSINESEVFRFLTKPCAPDELKRTIALATTLALEPGQAGAEGAAQAPPAATARPQREVPDYRPADAALYEPTSTQTLDDTVIVRTLAQAEAAPRQAFPEGFGILVFSNDEHTHEMALQATRGRVPVHRASNIVQVVKILDEKRPGVLLTDISEDRSTIQTMTARLKQHLPQLVTVAVSEHRDILDMVWLINHGQIFRFLRKPLSPGRCALSLKAALEHHRRLLDDPALVKRHTVEATAETSEESPVFARLKFLKKLWNGR